MNNFFSLNKISIIYLKMTPIDFGNNQNTMPRVTWVIYALTIKMSVKDETWNSIIS